jgi:TPR repeat protein
MKGIEIEKNLVEACRCFQKSGELGCDYGWFQYGICLLNGIGIERNLVESYKDFEKSAQIGNKPSILFQAFFLDEGLVVEKDVNRATSLFELLSKSYDPEAEFRYGVALVEGRGTEKKYFQGIQLIENASNQGVTMAQICLSTLSQTHQLVR